MRSAIIIALLTLAPVTFAQEEVVIQSLEAESLDIRDLEIEQVRSFLIVRGTAADQQSLDTVDRIVRTKTTLPILNVMTVEEPIPDRDILRSVERALHLNENLDSANISVNVVGGVVELTGFVESELEFEAAADMASTVDGVARVTNLLSYTD